MESRRVVRALTIGLLPLCAGPPAFSDAGASPFTRIEEEGAPGLYLGVCDNGLTIVADGRPGSRTVFARIAIHVGSRDEEPRHAGISHLLEHLLFKEGHPDVPAEPGARSLNPALSALRSAGAVVNATTDFELTEFHADLPASRFAQGWDALVALVTQADFDDEDIERERAVVLQEIARGKTDPLAIAAYSVLRRLFPDDPLGHPVIGFRRSLRHIKKEDLIRLHDRFYVPGNMFAVIVGDIDPLVAGRRACAGLGSAGEGKGIPARPSPSPDVEALYRFRTLTSRAYLIAGALTAGEASDDAPALSLLATLLGEGRTSRLHRRLVDREALTDEVIAVDFQVSNTGAFGAGVAVDPDDTEAARAALLEEMARLAADPVDKTEIETARRRIRGTLALAFETNEGIASFRTRRLQFGQPVGLTSWLRTLERIDPDRLREVADEHWGPANDAVGGPIEIQVLPARGLGKLFALLRYLLFRRL